MHLGFENKSIYLERMFHEKKSVCQNLSRWYKDFII